MIFHSEETYAVYGIIRTTHLKKLDLLKHTRDDLDYDWLPFKLTNYITINYITTLHMKLTPLAVRTGFAFNFGRSSCNPTKHRMNAISQKFHEISQSFAVLPYKN